MIKLQLDTTGLRAMIKDNPSFALDIQNAVLANIRMDTVKASIEGQIETILKSMATKGGSYYSPTYTITDERLLNAIKQLVVTTAKTLAEQAVCDKVTQLVEAERLLVRQTFKTEAKQALMEAITPEMANVCVSTVDDITSLIEDAEFSLGELELDKV